MRYLLSSIVLILITSCASYPKKNGFSPLDSETTALANPYFSDATKDYIYKATIDAFGNTFSGIFVVKKMGDAHHRIAFTTEMGNTIFDFTFRGEVFRVNRILKKMDRKILINILKSDFRVLIKETLSPIARFQNVSHTLYEQPIAGKKYYYFQSDTTLEQVVRVRGTTEKVVFLFSEINDNIAQHIRIEHKNFNLKIDLKSI